MWSLVAFSIPEDNRAARDALRKQLRWRGFAPLYDGLWVSPRDHAAEVIGCLKDLDITTGHRVRVDLGADGAASIPARAWDLDGLRQRYECFIAFACEVRGTRRRPGGYRRSTRSSREPGSWTSGAPSRAWIPTCPRELLPGGVAAGGTPVSCSSV